MAIEEENKKADITISFSIREPRQDII